jgi:hypothetical protein
MAGGAALRGLKHMLLGMLASEIVRPLAFACLVLLTTASVSGGMTAWHAPLLHSGAAAVAGLVGFVVSLQRMRLTELLAEPRYRVEHRRWVGALGPLGQLPESSGAFGMCRFPCAWRI